MSLCPDELHIERALSPLSLPAWSAAEVIRRSELSHGVMNGHSGLGKTEALGSNPTPPLPASPLPTSSLHFFICQVNSVTLTLRDGGILCELHHQVLGCFGHLGGSVGLKAGPGRWDRHKRHKWGSVAAQGTASEHVPSDIQKQVAAISRLIN